jgi:arylsulfatase
LAFFATHAEDENPLQFLQQPESMKLYQNDTVPVPVNANEESFLRLPPFIANAKNEGRNRWTWRFDTPEKYQTMMKNHYRLATGVDTTCGRFLAELKKLGILENTLVIFTGDNGYYHGEHGLVDKWYPHEESIRVTLIIRDPRMSQSKMGGPDDAGALSLDLAPTILAAAGMDAPPKTQGSGIAPLYLNDKRPERCAEFFYGPAMIKDKTLIPASEALVRKTWKYFFRPDFGTEQLFQPHRGSHRNHPWG